MTRIWLTANYLFFCRGKRCSKIMFVQCQSCFLPGFLCCCEALHRNCVRPPEGEKGIQCRWKWLWVESHWMELWVSGVAQPLLSPENRQCTSRTAERGHRYGNQTRSGTVVVKMPLSSLLRKSWWARMGKGKVEVCRHIGCILCGVH